MHEINRRTVLRLTAGATAGSLAGCTSVPESAGRRTSNGRTKTENGDDGGRPQTPKPGYHHEEETPPGKPIDGFPRKVSVKSFDDTHLRERYDIAASLDVTVPTVTATHTAKVQLSLTNQTGATKKLYRQTDDCWEYRTTLTYQGQVPDVGDDGVAVVRLNLTATNAGNKASAYDCWILDAEDMEDRCGTSPGVDNVPISFGAHETRSWDFSLWAPRRNVTSKGTCMPVGTYESGFTFTPEPVVRPPRTPAPIEELPPHPPEGITFTLDIEKPDSSNTSDSSCFWFLC